MSQTKLSLFEFEDYKIYLKQSIQRMPSKGRGFRSTLAKNLRCQTSYISNILNGSSHLTPEHGINVSHLLGHSEEEQTYFVLLIQLERAGSADLKSFYTKQIRQLQSNRLLLRERIQIKSKMSLEDQTKYYSQWYYAAIHIFCAIPRFRKASEIAHSLHLPLRIVTEALEFLSSCGLVASSAEGYILQEVRIHLSGASPLISRHHSNWRMQALRSLELSAQNKDLHYTSIITLSKKDAVKIQKTFIQMIEDYNQTVAQSKPDEEVHCLNLDFFKVSL